MRVLWLCNRTISDQDRGDTGTWLGAMAGGLVGTAAVDLGIVAFGPCDEFTRQDAGPIRQWAVPSRAKVGRDGMLPTPLVDAIVAAGREFRPDLVHAWGVESSWGLLSSGGYWPVPGLLEIQGLKGACGRVFHGGLSVRQRLACIGPKEILRGRSVFADQRRFRKWGDIEQRIVAAHRFITIQSTWTEAQVRAMNPACRMFHTNRPLRQPFYDGTRWAPTGATAVFCSAAYPAPFKGLHDAVRALAIVRERLPEARLRIAGALQQPGIRTDGYVRWLNGLVRRLGLADAVDWLGPLGARQLVAELGAAAAAVLPSHIETYGVAFAEAMIIGVPCVVAYSGGAAFLGRDEETALFYPPGDEAMCAYQLERLLGEPELARRIGRRASDAATVRHDRGRVVERQLEIYRQVLSEASADRGAAPDLR